MEKAEDMPPSKTCGSCRRVGTDLKVCTACRSIHYCDVSCQKAHRKAHKDDCKEIAHAREVMEEFKANLMTEECPICMLRLPLLANEYIYMACCGKTICVGCTEASRKAHGRGVDSSADELPPCAFCRRLPPTSYEELLERVNKRIGEHRDSMAFMSMASLHREGMGVPKDYKMVFECFVKASDMGNVHGTHGVAVSYTNGMGVPIDEEKAKTYLEMAARQGHVEALVRLAGTHHKNIVIAAQYLRLAAKSGHEKSMENLKKFYRSSTDCSSNHNETCDCSSCNFQKNILTKDDLANTIRAFHSAQEELRSDERDLAREINMNSA